MGLKSVFETFFLNFETGAENSSFETFFETQSSVFFSFSPSFFSLSSLFLSLRFVFLYFLGFLVFFWTGEQFF